MLEKTFQVDFSIFKIENLIFFLYLFVQFKCCHIIFLTYIYNYYYFFNHIKLIEKLHFTPLNYTPIILTP